MLQLCGQIKNGVSEGQQNALSGQVEENNSASAAFLCLSLLYLKDMKKSNCLGKEKMLQ